MLLLGVPNLNTHTSLTFDALLGTHSVEERH